MHWFDKTRSIADLQLSNQRRTNSAVTTFVLGHASFEFIAQPFVVFFMTPFKGLK